MGYLEAVHQIDKRGEALGKVYPGQRWIELNGKYTPEELHAIADNLAERNAKVPKRNELQG